jgi:hypothetical protein
VSIIHDSEQLLQAIGVPAWLTPLVIERLGLDALFERAYSLGVEHGRAQVQGERQYAADLRQADALIGAMASALPPGEDDSCLQESPAKKAAWLKDVSRRLPVGSLVKGSRAGAVKDHDDRFSGFGVVLGYNVGVSGDWPFVVVKETETGDTRLAYDDELDCLEGGVQ